MISAHMNAYTKFLMDNKLLFNQTTDSVGQSGPQIQQINQPVTAPKVVQGQALPTIQLNQNVLNRNDPGFQAKNPSTPQGIMDDSSTEVSNMDLQELPGQQLPLVSPPQLGLNASNLANNLQIDLEDFLLSQACEAEKDVPQEEVNYVGPDVSEQMMLMVQNFLGRTRKASKVDDLVAEFLRPRNMPFLKSPKIEENVFLDLGTQARKFDKNCRELQSYLNAGMTALMRCIQSLIKHEKLHPLVTQSGVQAKKALQLMAFTNKEINNRRKDALRTTVNPEYLPLLNHALPPSNDWLLGGTLNDSIKQCDESKKLTDKLMKNRKVVNQNEDGQQETPQNQGYYKQRYRNRGSKRDYRNNNQANNRNHWTAPVQHLQQPVNFHQQQAVNWAQPNNFTSYWPQQYWQQQPPNQFQQQQTQNYPQQNQVNQQLGFHQQGQQKNFPQQNQPYGQQKKKF